MNLVVRCNKIPSKIQWKYLTIFGQKKLFFSKESYFRESWYDAHCSIGDEVLNLLKKLAVITLKPEAFCARKGHKLVQLLDANGFVPIRAMQIKYDRLTIREVWRYQFCEATIDRMELVDSLYGIGEGLTIFLLDIKPEAMPASARLHKLKGASEARFRSSLSFRSQLGVPNGVIRFFHVPDEPADIIRELGIFFTRQERMELWPNLREGRWYEDEPLSKIIDDIEDRTRENSFCPKKSWNRIFEKARSTSENDISKVEALKEHCNSRHELGWEDIFYPLHELGADITDILSIASGLIKQDVEGEFHLIDQDALRGWDPALFSDLRDTTPKNHVNGL